MMKQEPEIIGFNEMLREKHPERVYWLRPLLFPGALVMLYADPGIGKTFAVMGIGLASATNGSWLKWKSELKARIWHIEGEIGQEGMQRRGMKFLPSGGQMLDDEAYRLTRMRADKPQLMISKKEHHAWILEKAKNFDVLILDNYGCLALREGDESDVALWSKVKPLLLALRAAGKAVILVHHAGKSGSYLGTSEIAQPMDWIIKLSRTTDYEPGAGAKFLLEFQKERDGWGEDISPMVVSLVNSEHQLKWEYMNKADYLEREINRQRGLGMTDVQIAKELNQTLSYVRSFKPEVDTSIDVSECGSGGFLYSDEDTYF